MSLDFTTGPLTFNEFEPEVPGREQNRGDSPELPVLARRSLVGGDGGVGKHQGNEPHP